MDTYGSHLKDCLDLSPFCIHNNVSEIEKSLGITLDSERDKTDFLKELYGKRIKLAFLTDGRNPAYASKFDFIYKILPPKINFVDSLGSGDAFVAGIIHGLDKSLVFEESLKLAVSLGSVNAERFDACNISQEDADKFVDNLEVIPIGKKMKIINDSPNH